MEKGHVISSKQQTGDTNVWKWLRENIIFPILSLDCSACEDVRKPSAASQVWRKKAILALREEERNMSVLYPRFILSHLASCLQHVFLFGRHRVLPRPGLMRTAEAPTMKTVCALWMTDCPYTLHGTQPLPNPTPNTPPLSPPLLS